MTQPLVHSGEFRQVGKHETPWPSFVFAARNEILTGRTTELGRVIDLVVAQATTLHQRPGIIDEITSRYGLPTDVAQEWLDSVRFAPRGPLDQTLAPTVLDTLRQAGFS
ncbi:MAG: hypothetical protein R2706_11570 [Acidimicrobiales bacterium]